MSRATLAGATNALVAAVVLALGACAGGPARLPHGSKLEARSLGLSATSAPSVDEHWWQAFGDSQLDALVERSVRDSPSLAEAMARVARAQADSRVAASARGLQAKASASVYRAYYNSEGILPPKYNSGTAWASLVNFGLSWNLDFWGRQRELVRAAERRGRAGEFDARSARLALEASVVSTYLELDRAHALADNATAIARNRNELAELTRRRVMAGVDTNVELRTAAARVPEARVDEEQARSRIELAVHELAALSGQGATAYPLIARPQLAGDGALPLPAVLPADLLLRRSDVAAALARIDAADATEQAARLAAYPEIDLRAIAGLAALSLTELVSAPARNLGAGPGVRLPIFDAGRIRAERDSAGAELDAAIAAYNATVLAAVRQVGDLLTTLDVVGTVIRDQQRDVELLTDASRLAAERYGAGITTRLPVLEAEARLLGARDALIGSRTLEAEERVALLVAVGGSTAPLAPPSPASAKVSP